MIKIVKVPLWIYVHMHAHILSDKNVVITNKAFWVMKQLRNNSETIPASTAEHFWVMNILCCLVFGHNKINSVELTVCLFLEPNKKAVTI